MAVRGNIHMNTKIINVASMPWAAYEATKKLE